MPATTSLRRCEVSATGFADQEGCRPLFTPIVAVAVVETAADRGDRGGTKSNEREANLMSSL